MAVLEMAGVLRHELAGGVAHEEEWASRTRQREDLIGWYSVGDEEAEAHFDFTELEHLKIREILGDRLEVALSEDISLTIVSVAV